MLSMRLSLSLSSCSVVWSCIGSSPLTKLETAHFLRFAPRAAGGARSFLRQMLKQHVHAVMRGIFANGHLGDFLPLAFGGQVHGVHDASRPRHKVPRKPVNGH